MTLPFQSVPETATQQNFDQLARRFPIQGGDIAANAVGAKQLADGFVLELATTGTARKVAFGKSSTTFPGSTTTSAIKEISHGLGVEPLFVDAITLASEGATVPIEPRAIEGSFTSSVFKLRLYGSTNISATTINFLWFAIG